MNGRVKRPVEKERTFGTSVMPETSNSILELVSNFVAPSRCSQLVGSSLRKILRKYRQELPVSRETRYRAVYGVNFSGESRGADLTTLLAIVLRRAACDAAMLIDAMISKVMNCIRGVCERPQYRIIVTFAIIRNHNYCITRRKDT